MKIHKLVIIINDYADIGAAAVAESIKAICDERYTMCQESFTASVESVETGDTGVWVSSHPVFSKDKATRDAGLKRMFGDPVLCQCDATVEVPYLGVRAGGFTDENLR